MARQHTFEDSLREMEAVSQWHREEREREERRAAKEAACDPQRIAASVLDRFGIGYRARMMDREQIQALMIQAIKIGQVRECELGLAD